MTQDLTEPQNREYCDIYSSLFQCRRLPNYFLQNVNLLRGKSPASLDTAAKSTWRLFRELITNPEALESL